MRKNSHLLLLFAIACSCCGATPSSGPRKNITTITQESVRSGGGHGGGRLSLINYRFNHRRPRKKHLDVSELKLVLGSSYDPRFMSVEEPGREMASKEAGPLLVVNKDGWRFREMLQELEARNLTEQLQALAGEGTPFGRDQVRVVERWLLKKAACPVRYAWEDIGALFWPRYIRRGECSSEPGTCSWPSGMHCVPSSTTHIHILRWQCRTPRGGGNKGRNRKSAPKDTEDIKPLNLKCKWVRVPYPITSECMCTC